MITWKQTSSYAYTRHIDNEKLSEGFFVTKWAWPETMDKFDIFSSICKP